MKLFILSHLLSRFQYNDVKNHHFSTYANASQLKQLTQYPFVYFVTKYYPDKNPLIYDGSIMLGANQVQELQPYGFNLKGEGINVGIWDDGAVGTHIDLPINKRHCPSLQYVLLGYFE